MAKKNWWFNIVKNLFTCESTSNAEKGKPKGWKWFFDKFRFKQLPTSTPQEKSLSKTKEEQRKHVLHVAKVTTVAAEAAMAAAQAAVEVVRLTMASQSIRQDTEAWNMAAIRIQAAFRGYLARRALRALKGMVRIQALARGKAVRRQVIKELEHSRSIRRSQVQSHKLHRKNHSEGCETGEKFQSPRMSNEMFDISKLESKSQRQWSESLFSKEEIKSMFLKRHEIAMKREQMKQYSFSHRERRSHDQRVEETMPLWQRGGHNCQRTKWGDENTPLHFHTSRRICDHGGNLKLRPRNLLKEELLEELSSSSSYPRRSFCQMNVKPSVVDEDCHDQLTSSPIFPTYMAATESTKARMRSMSTPRQRGRYVDTCFDYESPYKSFRVYPWSSTNDHSKTSTVLW